MEAQFDCDQRDKLCLISCVHSICMRHAFKGDCVNKWTGWLHSLQDLRASLHTVCKWHLHIQQVYWQERLWWGKKVKKEKLLTYNPYDKNTNTNKKVVFEVDRSTSSLNTKSNFKLRINGHRWHSITPCCSFFHSQKLCSFIMSNCHLSVQVSEEYLMITFFSHHNLPSTLNEHLL